MKLASITFWDFWINFRKNALNFYKKEDSSKNLLVFAMAGEKKSGKPTVGRGLFLGLTLTLTILLLIVSTVMVIVLVLYFRARAELINNICPKLPERT